MSGYRSLVLVDWQILFKLLWRLFDASDLDFWASAATTFTFLTRFLNSTRRVHQEDLAPTFFNLAQNGLGPKDKSGPVLVWNQSMDTSKTTLENTIIQSADGEYLALCLEACMTTAAADKPIVTNIGLIPADNSTWQKVSQSSCNQFFVRLDGPWWLPLTFRNFLGLNGVDKAAEVHLAFSESLFPDWHLAAHGCQALTAFL